MILHLCAEKQDHAQMHDPQTIYVTKARTTKVIQNYKVDARTYISAEIRELRFL